MSTKPLLIVKWKDHSAEGGWADVDKFHSPSVCYSVGWLYKEDDEAITLAANWSPADEKYAHKEHQTGNLQFILKSCIVDRKIIRKQEK